MKCNASIKSLFFQKGLFEKLSKQSCPEGRTCHRGQKSGQKPNLTARFSAHRLSASYVRVCRHLFSIDREAIKRHGKLFSREEIEKFGTPQDQYGGYTNKSEGEFQGKTDPYNPFIDMGGYNCRHQYRWISEDLAKNIEPERFKTGK